MERVLGESIFLLGHLELLRDFLSPIPCSIPWSVTPRATSLHEDRALVVPGVVHARN